MTDKQSFDQNKYKQEFNRQNYSRVSVDLKKEKVVLFKQLCKENNITQASIIEEAIDKFIEKYK